MNPVGSLLFSWVIAPLAKQIASKVIAEVEAKYGLSNIVAELEKHLPHL